MTAEYAGAWGAAASQPAALVYAESPTLTSGSIRLKAEVWTGGERGWTVTCDHCRNAAHHCSGERCDCPCSKVVIEALDSA
jgi:hypothetical protein